jgi:beta-lactamase regulating signal transducer with metallopeptidase domain/protocatechuate 3,4-dioxygenase beta subunit
MWHGSAALTTSLAGFGLTWLVQSSALLSLGLLAGRLLRRSGPAVQSGVYRTTLAAVLICPAASALLSASGFDGLILRLPSPPAEAAPAIAAVLPLATSQPLTAENVKTLPFDAADRPAAPFPAAPSETRRATAATIVPTPPPPRPPVRAFGLAEGVALGLGLWVLGSAVMGLRLLVGQRRMARLRASAVPAESGAEALCRDLAARMRVCAPNVLRSPFLFSPCLDGLRRPAILLPEDVGENLRETFVHELAHLARRDGFWNLLRRTGVAALWVQPLLWVLSRRLEASAEDVCDDYVVQFGADRARYAGHLLELACRALPPATPSGVGMISLRSMLARRVVRILDTSRSLSTRVGKRAVAAMLAVGLAGTLLAGLLGVAGGKQQALAQSPAKAAESKAEPEDGISRGQVVGPDGKPVPGASVIATRSRMILTGIGDEMGTNREYLSVRKTVDQDGRFEVAFETPRKDPEKPEFGPGEQILATAPGFGLGYYLQGQPIRLRSGDLPIKGRLVDLEGRPVAGAKVRLGGISIPAEGVAHGKVSASKPWSREGRLELNAEPLLPDGLVTDADGRFRIEGLGRDVLAALTISGPTVAFKRVTVVTRAMDRVADDPPRDVAFVGLDDPVTYGADCTIAVEPTRPIEGVVRDAETEEPIPGAVVTAASLSGSDLMIDGFVSTETDAQGRYRLVGLPKEGGNGHKIAVYPPFDRPYFITRRIAVPAAPGFEPVKFDVALKRGTWITGKVTDVGTGKPVRAAVDYFPFLSNTHAKDYPNFDPNVTASVGIKTRYRTDRDGRFRIVGLPGGGVVTAHTDDKSYRVGVGAEAIKGRTGQDQLLTYDRIFPSLYQGLKEVDIPEGAASVACDLGLDPGGSVRVRIVDEAGAPVTGAVVWGRFPEGSDFGDHNLYGESVARVAGLVPGKPRTLLIQHRDRKIGAVLTIPPDGPKNDAEVTATLRPNATLTGRLVDGMRKPVSGGVRVVLILAETSFFRHLPVETATLDADGRFRCEGVPAGGPYEVTAANRLVNGYGLKMEPEAFKGFALARGLKVEPGQAVDLGTVDVNSTKRVDVQEPSAAKGARSDVPINGRVVDLEGRPVAGVAVKVGGVQGSKSGDLTAWIGGVRNGEPPWIAYRHLDDDVKVPENVRREATTDKDGRFRFEGLGGERVVGLTIKGDTVAYTTIDVVTRKTEPFPARGFPDTHGPGAQTVYGADFTFTASPGRPVEGVVRDAKTKGPMAGVSVESWRFAGSDFVDTRQLKSVTDEQGRFRIVGLPKGKGNVVIAVPNDDQPYFMRETSVGDPPGIEPVSVEIELHRGVMITGKVTNKATGKPVAEARLHYLPFLENKYVQALPEFGKGGNVNGFQTRYTTRADGTYKLVGMPGRAIVGVESVGKTPYRSGVGSETIKGLDRNGNYKTWNNPIWPGRSWPNTLVEIDPAEGAKALTLDAQLDPGLTLRTRIVDADGKPVPDATVTGGNRLRVGEGTPDALFGLASFRPDEVRSVVVRHDARKIGKVVRLRAGEGAKGPVVVTLAPMATIKGRVVDADGNPVLGATVRVDVEPTEGFIQIFANVVSDRDGRFEVLNVPTGCDYGLVAEAGTMIKERRVAFGKATVKPGETSDVGELRFKND